MDYLLLFLMLVVPAYVSNAVPVLLGGGMTIDDFLKAKVFGKNKTIRGLFSGIVFGTLASLIIMLVLPISLRSPYVLFGICSSIGAMLGDLLGSLIKRNISITEGKQFFLDQFLFIVVALILGYPFLAAYYELPIIAIILVITYFMHNIFNIIANKLGIKNVPW